MTRVRVARLSTKGGVTRVTLNSVDTPCSTSHEKPVDKQSATGLSCFFFRHHHRTLPCY